MSGSLSDAELLYFRNGGQSQFTTAVAAGKSSDTVIKPTLGRLVRILVTATGTTPLQIFDNATVGSGVVIGCLPASPAVGTVMVSDLPAFNGITLKGDPANPGVTIGFI